MSRLKQLADQINEKAPDLPKRETAGTTGYVTMAKLDMLRGLSSEERQIVLTLLALGYTWGKDS